MWYLALRTGGRRLAAMFAVACAILGGAALVTGTGVLTESGLRSHVPTGRLGGADIVVAADQAYHQRDEIDVPLPERATVPADLAARLSRLPGVTAAVADVSFPAALVGGRDAAVSSADPRVAGHGWSSVTLLAHPRVEGRAPAGAQDVAVDSAIAAAAGVHVGDLIGVSAVGTTATYRVCALVTAPGAGILFADPTATRLAARNRATLTGGAHPDQPGSATQNSGAHPDQPGSTTRNSGAGTADLVGVTTAPGAAGRVAASIREQLRGSGLVVATGDARGGVETPSAATARSLLLLISGSLAGITLLIVGFIVAGAMTVSIGGQRRELALLRAVGATPKQIRRLAAGQATLVSALALLPGGVLGYLAAEQFRRLLAGAGLMPDTLPLTFSPLPLLAAALLLLAVVQVSSRSAAWRTSRRPATEAVAEARAEPREPSRTRTSAGLLLVLAATVLSVAPLLSPTQVGAASTPVAGIVAAIGLSLCGPDLVRRAGAALARRLPARASAPTWLAVSNSHGYALRIAGAMTTLAMAVIFILTYTLTQTTVLGAVSGDVKAGIHAQASIAAPGLGGVPDGLLAEVRGTPGVRAAAPVGTTTVLLPDPIGGDSTLEATTALVLTPESASIVDPRVRSGGLDNLTGATVAVDARTASAEHLAVGRRMSLVLGDGARTSATVVAIYERGLGFGPAVLSRDLVAGHTTTGLDQSILVRTDGSAGTGSALAALAASRPGVTLRDAGTGIGGLGGTPPEVWVNLATLAVLLGYLLLGIANKLVATTAARRTELATLRLIGTTPRQIRAMMRREAALIFGFAVVTGTALSIIPLGFLGLGMLHRPWAAGPVWLLPATALIVGTIAFLATEIPTRQSLRAAPAHALAVRE